jgi:hypothetical protein
MTGNNPMSFFSDNVDAWGPLEWFNRLAKAVHARSRSVLEKDDLSFELYQNIASSSSTVLVSDFEDKVRMALTTLRELEKANVAYVDANTELLSTLESLQRENEELRKALLPFAELPDNAHGKNRYFLELLVCPDGDTPADGVKHYGEAIRTARTALASTGGEHHAE